ncbi:hypothetical protein HK104_000870 [Borealophlyctis nickersoniae]|nr:hypothetical protein HK104_000870 [Borealophlyctis nickersoniae]
MIPLPGGKKQPKKEPPGQGDDDNEKKDNEQPKADVKGKGKATEIEDSDKTNGTRREETSGKASTNKTLQRDTIATADGAGGPSSAKATKNASKKKKSTKNDESKRKVGHMTFVKDPENYVDFATAVRELLEDVQRTPEFEGRTKLTKDSLIGSKTERDAMSDVFKERAEEFFSRKHQQEKGLADSGAYDESGPELHEEDTCYRGNDNHPVMKRDVARSAVCSIVRNWLGRDIERRELLLRVLQEGSDNAETATGRGDENDDTQGNDGGTGERDRDVQDGAGGTAKVVKEEGQKKER